jgi:hypothetical protein
VIDPNEEEQAHNLFRRDSAEDLLRLHAEDEEQVNSVVIHRGWAIPAMAFRDLLIIEMVYRGLWQPPSPARAAGSAPAPLPGGLARAGTVRRRRRVVG